MKNKSWTFACLLILLLSFALQSEMTPKAQAQIQSPVENDRYLLQQSYPYSIYLPVVFRAFTEEMVKVDSGWFLMGCDPGNNAIVDCQSDEEPLHWVYLYDYWMDRTEVTNARYAQCVTAGACNPPASDASSSRSDYYTNPTYAQYPVINVSWVDASTFCAWAGKRLPTEAEWEKAARGESDTRPYPWGNEVPSCSLANIAGCEGDTSQVGMYPGGDSPYGIHDLEGNVVEWVNDWYQWDYYYESPDVNPTGPDTGDYRVRRGGAFNFNYDYPEHRIAFRQTNIESSGYGLEIGFRCAATNH